MSIFIPPFSVGRARECVIVRRSSCAWRRRDLQLWICEIELTIEVCDTHSSWLTAWHWSRWQRSELRLGLYRHSAVIPTACPCGVPSGAIARASGQERCRNQRSYHIESIASLVSDICYESKMLFYIKPVYFFWSLNFSRVSLVYFLLARAHL